MGRLWRGMMFAAALILGLAWLTYSVEAGTLKWSRLGFLQGVAGQQPAAVALAAHPTNRNVLYAGTWLTTPNAALVYRSDDGGGTWQPAAGGLPTDMPANTGVADLIIDPAKPNVLYVALQRRGVWRSDNGGNSWQNAGGGALDDDADVVALAIDPGSPSIVYALTSDGVVMLDGNWKERSRGLPSRDVVFNDIAIDPTDADTIYVATNPSGLYRTTNGGRQWRSANSNLPGKQQNVREMAFSPSGELFISLRDAGLLRSRDRGTTWSPAGTGITYTTTMPGTISAPVFEPEKGEIAYAYNSDGVFRSADGGATWSRFSDGLSVTAVVMKMIFAPARSNYVVAGTAASGVWAAYDHEIDPPDPPDPPPPTRLLFMPMIRK